MEEEYVAIHTHMQLIYMMPYDTSAREKEKPELIEMYNDDDQTKANMSSSMSIYFEEF